MTSARSGYRVGTFDTLDEAMTLGKRMLDTAIDDAKYTKTHPAFVVHSTDGHTLGGVLVAAFDPESGWHQLDPAEPEPEWWPRLSARAQRWIVENPHEDLPAWMVEEAAKSGARVISAYWVEQGPRGQFTLPDAAERWATRRALIEAYERS